MLQLQALTKTFPGVRAVDGADLTLEAGEVHALVGENGAGKSTLVRMIAGLETPDAGFMTLEGASYAPGDKLEAEGRGVRIVTQELSLVGTLSIAENVFMNRLPHRFGLIDRWRLGRDTREVLSRLGLSRLDPDTPVDRLGVGVRQMVEIASGLSQRCRVFILDEPTSALTDTETEALFEQIRRLTAEGVGILYISHRLEEIGRIAHRVTVMRDGRIVGTDRIEALSREEIVTRMVGRDIRQNAPKFNCPTTTPGLTVRGLTCPPVHDVSFEVYRGEIFGIAGLMGSGRTELMRAIFGADRSRRGEVCVGGASTPARIRSPRDAVRCGIALLTEDRKAQGLLGPLPVRWNASLASLDRVSHAGWVSTRKEREDVHRLAGTLSIKCATIEQPVTNLSGGNQQKVVLAKWLMRDCEVFVFDEPTRGIDVGAKFEIYNLLSELANRGKAIVVVSSELPELLGVCDRIGVMSAGRMSTVFSRHEFSQQRIMEAALSGYDS